MNFEIVPALSSLIFLVILSLVYVSKKQINNFSNKIFKSLIYIVILFNIIETILYITEITIISKIYYALCLISFLLLFIYLYLKLNNKIKNVKELLKQKLIIFLLVITIILSIIILIMPINANLINNNFNNILLIIYSFIIIIGILYMYIVNINNISKILKFVIFISIFNFIFTILLGILFNTLLFSEFCTINIYILYYSLANPDISIIDEINIVQKDIEKINKTKTDFLSNISYEIKVPIDLIDNLCDDIVSSNDFDNDKIKRDLKDIIISGNNLIEIVSDVLDISRIESGKNVINEKEYYLKDMIDDLISLASNKMGNKNVTLETNIDNSLPSGLYGDYSKLYRAVSNILNNAVKFTEVGKVILTIKGEIKDNRIKLLFIISDTGNGIKEEDKNLLFSKGFKAINKGDEVGSGYGLSISKEYISALGGNIWFESNYGAGSIFYIEVNQYIKDFNPINEYKKEEDLFNIDLSNKRVLVVDDNKPNIKVIKRLLEKYNLIVDSVSSGEECVYKIKSEEHYDLIFMDHIMEEMDGIETLHVIKSLEGYTIPPVISLTANALNDTKDLYIKEGFDDYLSKPVTIKDLEKVIKKYFKNS